jgi:CRP-like cAMP-binding protein
MAINPQTHLFDKRELVSPSILSGNDLLRVLLEMPEVGNDLLPHLKIGSFSVNQVLYESGDKIDFVYFPIDSVVSALAIMEDGTTLETSMIGREGMIGISSILGSGKSRQWMWVTVAGNAVQLEARLLERVFVKNEVALKSLLRYYRSLVTQVSQRCVCNTRHTILERMCCWLLMINDRVGGSNLRLTQEAIASRVGARRAGITVAAGMLQDMQAIEYRRGQLHIRRREILERTVCECYAVLKADFNGLWIDSHSTPSL